MPKKPVTSKKKRIDTSELPPLYKCTKCGKLVQEAKGAFFLSRHSDMYEGNEHHSHLCVRCVNAMYENFKIKYRDEKIALILTCCAIGMYYSDELYEGIKDDGEIKFGNYIKKLNIAQYRNRNFNTFLLALLRNELRSRQEIQEGFECSWSVAEQVSVK